MITRQKQELHIKDENYLWTLRNQRRTLRIESLDVSIITYMDI